MLNFLSPSMPGAWGIRPLGVQHITYLFFSFSVNESPRKTGRESINQNKSELPSLVLLSMKVSDMDSCYTLQKLYIVTRAKCPNFTKISSDFLLSWTDNVISLTLYFFFQCITTSWEARLAGNF